MSRIEQALERARMQQEKTGAEKPATHVATTPAATGNRSMAKSHTVISGTPNSPHSDIPVFRQSYEAQQNGPEIKVDTQNPMLVCAHSANPLAGEEYRKLKEQLIKQAKKGGFKNMVLVTSATTGEGKSLTAVNLALTLAQEFDHTVLLIDADLRRPSCNHLLGLPQSPGLADCLLEDLPVQNALIHTGIGRLAFLPAGNPINNPSEVFASTMMRNFLVEVKHRYADRFVIIDTPPILPFAETRVLSQVVDGAIIVVREGCISMPQLEETVRSVGDTTLFGIVYNAAKPNKASGYYGGYGSYGGYGY